MHSLVLCIECVEHLGLVLRENEGVEVIDVVLVGLVKLSHYDSTGVAEGETRTGGSDHLTSIDASIFLSSLVP